MTERGKFIVVYGANNLGKSTQIDLLAEELREEGKEVELLKYPIYELEPTGPIINAAIREGLEITEIELQRVFAQNRQDFEPFLMKEILEKGKWVIAEDYKGTGIAWGMARNIPVEVMEEMNSGLLEEDLAILLDGEQFVSGIERGHRNEPSSEWRWARQVHKELAERYGWQVVEASRSRETVADEIWKIVVEKFLID